MDAVTLIIAVLALVIAILAFVRSGGIRDVRRQVEAMGSKTETARDRTADVLDRVERLIRGRDKSEREQGPGGSSTAE